eukprot:NODE_15725_length_1034_cov_2.059537.p7 GENE.NODE_15725_length_1034_cov_2.059537~~NODE_15725_length_1034_cov_2.059537.p7  ORF type:complete len:59 (-),score=7.03 NODE_15725_length_1034_cov_2.059537:260-436(-)
MQPCSLSRMLTEQLLPLAANLLDGLLGQFRKDNELVYVGCGRVAIGAGTLQVLRRTGS